MGCTQSTAKPPAPPASECPEHKGDTLQQDIEDSQCSTTEASINPALSEVDEADISFVARGDDVGTSTLDPTTTWGAWEGWGVSLCWWANVFGEEDILADLTFTMNHGQLGGQDLPGLGLNIARYNVGGCAWREVDGKSMQVSPNIPHFKQIEGFWQDNDSDDPDSSSFDWSVDRKQVAMLTKAHARGAVKLELFSNSPMWWMCDNHNPSGSWTGLTNNLSKRNSEVFAKYLAITAEYFHLHKGITFTSVEAFNEPNSKWWRSSGTQEGCKMDTRLQSSVLGDLCAQVRSRGSFADELVITTSDWNEYDEALRGWRELARQKTATGTSLRSVVGKVNVHGYQTHSRNRQNLFAAVDGKTLWQSEYGDEEGDGLNMAKSLNKDFHQLHPTAWCYWQVVDEADGWGLLQARMDNENASIEDALQKVNTKWYVFAQYTRHIRQGMIIIDSGREDTVAAYDDVAQKVVLVVANVGDNAQWVTFDLSKFNVVEGPALRWCTSATGEDKYAKKEPVIFTGKMFTVELAAKTVQTFEVPFVSLPNIPVLHRAVVEQNCCMCW